MTLSAAELGASRHVSSTRIAGAVAGRSLRLIPRVPSTFVPSIVFPAVTVVAFSGAFASLVRLPGFPVDKMIDWMLPMSVVQGAAFSGVTTGMGTARDIENGFFSRFLLAPVSTSSLVVGPLLAGVLRAVIPFFVVLAAGLLAGATLRGGVLGAITLLIASCGAALVAAGWSLGLAFRVPTQRATPLMQVPIFFGTFLSTAQVPESLMTGWLRAVAKVNPITYMLELGRQGFIGHVTWAQTWPGLVAIAGLGGVTTIFAFRGSRKLIP